MFVPLWCNSEASFFHMCSFRRCDVHVPFGLKWWIHGKPCHFDVSRVHRNEQKKHHNQRLLGNLKKRSTKWGNETPITWWSMFFRFQPRVFKGNMSQKYFSYPFRCVFNPNSVKSPTNSCLHKLHQKLNGTESQRTPDQVSCDRAMIDTQV